VLGQKEGNRRGKESLHANCAREPRLLLQREKTPSNVEAKGEGRKALGKVTEATKKVLAERRKACSNKKKTDATARGITPNQRGIKSGEKKVLGRVRKKHERKSVLSKDRREKEDVGAKTVKKKREYRGGTKPTACGAG